MTENRLVSFAKILLVIVDIRVVDKIFLFAFLLQMSMIYTSLYTDPIKLYLKHIF